MKKTNLKKVVVSVSFLGGSLALMLIAGVHSARAEGTGNANAAGAVHHSQHIAGQVNRQMQGAQADCHGGAAPAGNAMADMMAARNARMRQAHLHQNELEAHEAAEARRVWDEQLAIDNEVQAFRLRILEAKPSQLQALRREAEATAFANELISTFELVEKFPEFESKHAFETVDEINAYLDRLMHLDKHYEFKDQVQAEAFERFKDRATTRMQAIIQHLIGKVERMGMLQAHPKAIVKFAKNIDRMAVKLGAPLRPEFKSVMNAVAVKLILKNLELVASHANTAEKFAQAVHNASEQIRAFRLHETTTEAQQREYGAMLSGAILNSAHAVKLDFSRNTTAVERTLQRQAVIDGLNGIGRIFKVELGLTQRHVEIEMDTTRDEQIAAEKARKAEIKRQRRDQEEAQRLARQLQMEEDEALARRLANGEN